MKGWPIRVVVGLWALTAYFLGSGLADERRPREFTDTVGGFPIITVLPKDAIPAIDDPKFVSTRDADRVMTLDEPVLGVADGSSAKAYSFWQLNHHEIVNDRIGALPVAVTW